MEENLNNNNYNNGAVLNPSIPSGEQTVWADVSSLLNSACNDLQNGELIHGENFNLFAAMSALEIMDPKMDSGIVCKYYSVEEAIEDGAAPIPLSQNKTVDVHCIIDVMDHLLSCEATWHKGHSLAQTIFSCIYLLRPDRTLSHALLNSYCTVTRLTCNAVISVVSDTRTHEEEDLFTITSGLPLKKDGDEKCLSMLNVIEETVSRQLNACKSPSHKKRAIEDIEPLQTNLDLEEGYCKAVLCRLRFRKHFYHVLVCLRRAQGRGLDTARKHIASCLTELHNMLKTEEFLMLNSNRYGVSEDGKKNSSTTASGCQPIGFDSSLNSRLSAPTPPRAIKLLSWKKAVEYFEKLLHDLDVVCSHPLDSSFEGILRFVVEFQKFQPDLVARSHLQLLLVQDGKLHGRDPMFAVICKAAAVPEITNNLDLQKNESFVHLCQLVILLLKILCTNAAWQRRQLGKILQDWRIIHMQLELALRKEFEENSSTTMHESLFMKMYKHILNWIEEQTYWIALRFLVLGFELELYSPTEYCMVYWYIYVILIKLGEKVHLRMITSTESGKRKGKKKKESNKDVGRDHSIPPAAVMLLQCHIYLAQGLTMMIAALRNEHGVFQCRGPFNTEQERFIQHFELLQKACIPDHVSYYSFRDYTAHAQFDTIVMGSYFKEAQRIAKDLRSSFTNDTNKLAELRHIEQVAEHNGIALNLVSRLVSLDPSLKVSFEFNHHPHFATAVVKRS